MKKIKMLILNHKKTIIIIGAIILLSFSGIGAYFIFKEKPKTLPLNVEKNKVENIYTMYVKINPLVKLVLKETYTECIEEDGSKSICVEATDSVIGYELINDDAKDIYDNLDFNGKTVLDALVMLCDTARDNDIGFEKLEITSDWDNIYNEEQIKEALKENSKYEYEIGVYVDFTEYPENSNILEDITKYTVTFDSNGGSDVESQVILKNSKVTKPEEPKKEGYEFIEWQLNKKTYNFNNEVTKDITLKAKWKKLENKTTESDDKTSTETNEKPSTNNTKEEEVIVKDTTESRIERINLNENILFYHSGNGFGGGCGVSRYMLFATNLESLFPGYVKNKTITLITQEDIERQAEQGFEFDTTGLLLDTEFENKYNQITFDATKEANLIKAFDALASNKTAGIDGFKYEFRNHQLIRYSYGTISLEESDKFITLNKSLTSTRSKIDDQINKATKDMYVIINYFGGCGSMEPPELLTEEVCNKYNLNCERW